MNTAVSLIGYGLVAIFGIFLSALFSGIELKNKHFLWLSIFSVAALAVQAVSYFLFGVERTAQFYPLILHLPLVVFLVLCFKKAWSISAVSVFLAYLCCQIPRWLSNVTLLFSGNAIYRDILYLFLVSGTFAAIYRYAAKPVRKLLTYSPLSVWGVGLLPILYYIFDYVTTVYTDILYSGDPIIVQTMPSVMSVGYLLFLFVYQARLEKQEAAQKERYLLSLQLRRSEAEYAALCRIQEQANRFHHDMRHHAALLMDYTEKGALSEIKAYLQELQQDLDTAVFKRFCNHQVVNLLLSHFETQANSLGVHLSVNAQLPSALPFKDTELCSLLSNGLENALSAAASQDGPEGKVITVSLSVRQRNLLLSIQNPYSGDVEFEDGLPITHEAGHGLGTRIISSIVNKYGGLVHFSAADGIFLMRASLPMD